METQSTVENYRRDLAAWVGGKVFREKRTAGKSHQGLVRQRWAGGKNRGTVEKMLSSRA